MFCLFQWFQFYNEHFLRTFKILLFVEIWAGLKYQNLSIALKLKSILFLTFWYFSLFVPRFEMTMFEKWTNLHCVDDLQWKKTKVVRCGWTHKAMPAAVPVLRTTTMPGSGPPVSGRNLKWVPLCRRFQRLGVETALHSMFMQHVCSL